MNRFRLGCNGGLHRCNLGSIRIDPVQTGALSHGSQFAQGQNKSLYRWHGGAIGGNGGSRRWHRRCHVCLRWHRDSNSHWGCYHGPCFGGGRWHCDHGDRRRDCLGHGCLGRHGSRAHGLVRTGSGAGRGCACGEVRLARLGGGLFVGCSVLSSNGFRALGAFAAVASLTTLRAWSTVTVAATGAPFARLLRSSAALSLLFAALDAGSHIGTRCQGISLLPFRHTIAVGPDGLVWATAALGSALAAAAFAPVVALTTLTTLAIAAWSLGACFGGRCVCSRHRGLWQVHAVVAARLAVGVHTVTLAWSGAFAPAPAAPSATSFTPAFATALAPAFTATTSAIGSGLTPTVSARFAAACAIPATAVALVIFGGLYDRLRCGHRCGSRCWRKQLFDPAKKALFCRRRWRWCWRCRPHGRCGCHW